MFDSNFVIIIILLYMGGLFLFALWVERMDKKGIRITRNPAVYSLSLAVYCTAWTYFGSTGLATKSGLSYLAVYLGPMLAAIFWWKILRKYIRLKNRFRITSIADFLSARYGMSQSIAALVSLMAVVGVMPYIALQLKAVISSFMVLTDIPGTQQSWTSAHMGPIVVLMTIAFTIVLGARKLDPTERHQGIVAVVALESVVKLVAFLLVGIFVTYHLFDGFGDIFQRLEESRFSAQLLGMGGKSAHASGFISWMTFTVLSVAAIMFLPRQFHLAVVENSDEKHIRTAMWMFPLYMLVINIFVIPIAGGGLLLGLPPDQADTFVLRLPLDHGNRWRALLVFLGGISAATSMVMISSMTLATMCSNHLLLPLLGRLRSFEFLPRNMLPMRWALIAIIISAGFWFETQITAPYMLVNIGIISFAAVFQFAPAMLGAVFWRRANKAGAILGLSVGFLVWIYTLLVPAFIKSGWLHEYSHLLSSGPWGLSFLNPERLFGLVVLDPLSHCVFWSILLNGGLYMVGSMLFHASEDENKTAAIFTGKIHEKPTQPKGRKSGRHIALEDKERLVEKVLIRFFKPRQAAVKIFEMKRACGLEDREKISILELSDFYTEMEKLLAGSFGAAMAHSTVKKERLYSEQESVDLTMAYGRLLTELNIPPDELNARIDFYRERERLMALHFKELERTVMQRETEIFERKRAEAGMRESERRYRHLVEQSPISIYIHRDGRVVFANQVGATMLGTDLPLELIGRSLLDIVHPDFHHLLDQSVRNAEEAETGLALTEQRLVKLDGTVIDVEVKTIPCIYEDLPAVQVVAIDIGERKRAERQQRQLEQQVRQQQKLESLGTLASGVAHEINNPVNAIMNYGQLIFDRLLGDEKLKTFAGEIVHESERIGKIVHNLLAFSRPDMEARSPVDIQDVVNGTMLLISTVIKKDHIHLNVDIPDALPLLKCHSQQIQQVLMNLMTNARDALNERYLEGEGSKTIDISACLIEDLEGRWIRTSVRDNGTGINPEIASRLFDPFFSTKQTGSGTGLGLSVSHGIVKEHQGRMTVESKPGVFTCFNVDLPLAAED